MSARWYPKNLADTDHCGTCGDEIEEDGVVGYDHDYDGGEQGHCKPCLTEED